MFDKRRVSLKKLAAKQTRPVQPVAPRPEAFIKSPQSSPGQSLYRSINADRCNTLFTNFYSLFILSSTVHKTLQEKNTSETQFEISCDKVRLNNVCSHPLPSLLLMILSWCFSTGEWTTAGWRTQQTSIPLGGGGEPGSAEEVRDQPSLFHRESNYTADGLGLRFLCWLPSFISTYTISSLSVCRHVMNELLETERAYVEELLCVLQVGINSSLTLV